MVHRRNDPNLQPSTDEELISQKDKDEADLIPENGGIEEVDLIPTPEHTPLDDAREAGEFEQEDGESGGWFSRLSRGLSKSSGKLTAGLGDILTKKKLDAQTLEELEDALIAADLGPQTAHRIIESFSKGRFGKDLEENEIRLALADAITEILEPVARPIKITKPEKGPFTILVTGVNGVGKTTTIGKMAWEIRMREKAKVMIAAGDTFRAAAIEQLQIWGKRAHCDVLSKEIGADAASVAYEAYEKAAKQGHDVLLIDTAGRLHNKANLMAELEKIVRVLQKHDEDIPHEVLLVLDATTGQNAHAQVETFKDMVNLTGLVVTKLDGSARGGIVVALADKFKLPIYAIGVGEDIEDLQPFHPREFAIALVGAEG